MQYHAHWCPSPKITCYQGTLRCPYFPRPVVCKLSGLERRDEVMKQMLGDVKILLAQLDPVPTNMHQAAKLLESSNQRLTHQLERLKTLLRQHSSHMDTSKGIMKEELSQKSNEQLRVHLIAVQSQMSSTERKLEEAKVLADSLRSQVQNLQVEMNRKHKLRSEQEVEREAENKRLQEELIIKSQVLSEAIQAADVIIDDLIALKKLLKEAGTDVQINWTRLESRGNSLKDVMHVCRCCVNEVGQEVLKSQNMLKQAEQINLCLNEKTKELTQHVGILEEQTLSLTRELQQTIKDRDELLQEKYNVTDQNNRLQGMLGQTQDDNTRLKKLLDENNKIVNDHHRTLEEKEKLITDLQTCLCDLNEVGQQEVLTLNREKEQLECALELESSINTGELDTAREENSRIKQILEMKERDLDSAAHKIKEQDNQLAQLRQERDNLIYSYQENLKSKEDILILREKLTNHENIVLQREQLAANQVELLERIDNYRNNLESLQLNNEQLINCHQQLSLKVNDLENELHKVSEALNKSQEVVDASYQEN
uniref:Uncharacterized protein n=1 Tax=Timema douglasi TaxID=61478 RepID=A0A7R8Z314_TIMDO|nr:unnamed protein product [Timema douglasi]